MGEGEGFLLLCLPTPIIQSLSLFCAVEAEPCDLHLPGSFPACWLLAGSTSGSDWQPFESGDQRGQWVFLPHSLLLWAVMVLPPRFSFYSKAPTIIGQPWYHFLLVPSVIRAPTMPLLLDCGGLIMRCCFPLSALKEETQNLLSRILFPAGILTDIAIYYYYFFLIWV